MVRREVSARVRQEYLTYVSTQTEFAGCVDVEGERIHTCRKIRLVPPDISTNFHGVLAHLNATNSN